MIYSKLKNTPKNIIIAIQSIVIVILVIYVVNLRSENSGLSYDVDYANSQTEQLSEDVDKVNSNFDNQDWSDARESLNDLSQDTQYQ